MEINSYPTYSSINPFLAIAPILYPLKTTEKQGFLVFSGSTKWKRWPEMG